MLKIIRQLLKKKAAAYILVITFTFLYFVALRLPYFNTSENQSQSVLLFFALFILFLFNPTARFITQFSLITVLVACIGQLFNMRALYENLGVLLYIVLLYVVVRYITNSIGNRKD
jgi:hypothetical protein